MPTISNSESAIKITIKRGVTKPNNTDNYFEEQLVRSTKMVSDLFDFKKLQESDSFGIKSYKDSYFVGELDPASGMRDGFGICVYNN